MLASKREHGTGYVGMAPDTSGWHPRCRDSTRCATSNRWLFAGAGVQVELQQPAFDRAVEEFGAAARAEAHLLAGVQIAGQHIGGVPRPALLEHVANAAIKIKN